MHLGYKPDFDAFRGNAKEAIAGAAVAYERLAQEGQVEDEFRKAS